MVRPGMAAKTTHSLQQLFISPLLACVTILSIWC